MSPIVVFLLGWLVGSFFGLTAVMGLVKGIASPKSAS